MFSILGFIINVYESECGCVCENKIVDVGIKDKPKGRNLECAFLMSSPNPMTKECVCMFVWIKMCMCVWECDCECVYEYK